MLRLWRKQRAALLSHSQVSRWQAVLPPRGGWKQARDSGGCWGLGAGGEWWAGRWRLLAALWSSFPAPSLAPFLLPVEAHTQGDAGYFCRSRIALGLACPLQDTKPKVSFLSNLTHKVLALSCQRLRNLSPSSCQGCTNPPVCDVRDARNPG